jgi:hypothetical protein
VAEALAYVGGFLEGRATVQQPPPQQPAPQQPAPNFSTAEAPGVHDEVGFWSQNDKARIDQLIQDLDQRFHVRVFVEAHLKMPPEWSRGVNLNDPAAKTQAFKGWLVKRTNELADGHPGITILVLACKEPDGYLTDVAWRTPGRSWTTQERDLTVSLNNGITQRLQGKFVQGLPDALAFVRDTLQANEGLVTGQPTPRGPGGH